MIDNIKNFNFKEFIWNRYDPYGHNSISVKDVYADIFLVAIGFIATILWFSGIITFYRVVLNPSIVISGVSFVIMVLALTCTVVVVILGLITLIFEMSEGNIKTWNRIMECKLLKR